MWPFGTKLSKQERQVIQQMQQIETAFLFVAQEVKNNTALVPKGQQFASQLEAAVKLISHKKNAYISNLLTKLGIAKAQVNIYTGKITPMPHAQPGDNSKAAKK